MSLRIAIDVGGTFTDGVLCDDATGRVWLAKALTTPTDPGEAISTVAAALLALDGSPEKITHVVHGTTLIANTLLERKGVRAALVTNSGMGDCLEIRRELRYDTYDLGLTYPAPLVPRDAVHELSARLGPDGTEWAPVDAGEITGIAARLENTGAEAVAICLLHAPVSDRHELAVAQRLASALPGIPVCHSATVAAEVGEYERMSTTVANAYVQPIVESYLDRLKGRFEAVGVAARVDVMLSNGGFTTASEAARFPIRVLESGPAGGVLSAINCATAEGIGKVMAFDMGGTTAKSCVAQDGRPDITHIFEFAREQRFKKGSGLPTVAPSIDLIEIGAGGGSIARVGPLGLLQVGPDSAGSEPGPACYGRGGTEATVTDADLVLGYLDPDGFLGGRMRLEADAARRALETVGGRLGLDATRTAIGINEIVSENMASAARMHIAEKGLDARDFALVATGGAGPVHGADVARRLRIRRILCPIASGVGSCLGFLAAPARADRSWARVEPAVTLDIATLAVRYADARASAAAELSDAGADPADIAWEAVVDMRYVGQGASVEVPVDPEGVTDTATLVRAFEEAYRAIFGRTVPDGIPEVVTWRLSAVAGAGVRHFRLAAESLAGEAPARRNIYTPATGGFCEVPMVKRASLSPGMTLRGPCLVTEAESTLVVPWPAEVTVRPSGTLDILLDEVSE